MAAVTSSSGRASLSATFSVLSNMSLGKATTLVTESAKAPSKVLEYFISLGSNVTAG